MFRFKDTILPLNRTIVNSLKKIFGVGMERASYIVNLFGFSYNFSVNYLNYYYFESMSAVLKLDYVSEDRLKFIIRNRFSLYRDVGLVRVKRYDSGLPSRGQRTHSNGRTQKRRRFN